MIPPNKKSSEFIENLIREQKKFEENLENNSQYCVELNGLDKVSDDNRDYLFSYKNVCGWYILGDRLVVLTSGFLEGEDCEAIRKKLGCQVEFVKEGEIRAQ